MKGDLDGKGERQPQKRDGKVVEGGRRNDILLGKGRQ